MPNLSHLTLSTILVVIVGAWSHVSSAQETPLNAHKNPYGPGWSCNRGFQNSSGKCIAVQVPANAELNYLGNGWQCKRGFQNSGGKCIAVQVPANAELNYLGSGWQCKRGFQNSGGKCIAVQVPANAELNILGNGWICSYGFKQVGNECSRMSPSELAVYNRLRAEILARRKQLLSSGDTYTSSKGAEFTVRVSSADLNCNEGYSNAYDSCEAEITFEIVTNYNGNDSPTVNVRCEAELSYTDKTGWGSSDSETESKSVSMYGQDETGRMELDFSFSEEVVRATLTEARCKITDVY